MHLMHTMFIMHYFIKEHMFYVLFHNRILRDTLTSFQKKRCSNINQISIRISIENLLLLFPMVKGCSSSLLHLMTGGGLPVALQDSVTFEFSMTVTFRFIMFVTNSGGSMKNKILAQMDWTGT